MSVWSPAGSLALTRAKAALRSSSKTKMPAIRASSGSVWRMMRQPLTSHRARTSRMGSLPSPRRRRSSSASRSAEMREYWGARSRRRPVCSSRSRYFSQVALNFRRSLRMRSSASARSKSRLERRPLVLEEVGDVLVQESGDLDEGLEARRPLAGFEEGDVLRGQAESLGERALAEVDLLAGPLESCPEKLVHDGAPPGRRR